MLQCERRLKVSERICWRGRHSLRGIRSGGGGLLLEADHVESSRGRSQRFVRAVVNVHKAEVEILAVVSAVCWLVVILEPVRANDVRSFQQAMQRIAKSGGAFPLRGDDRINA